MMTCLTRGSSDRDDGEDGENVPVERELLEGAAWKKGHRTAGCSRIQRVRKTVECHQLCHCGNHACFPGGPIGDGPQVVRLHLLPGRALST